jgi:hypothetical protein
MWSKAGVIGVVLAIGFGCDENPPEVLDDQGVARMTGQDLALPGISEDMGIPRGTPPPEMGVNMGDGGEGGAGGNAEPPFCMVGDPELCDDFDNDCDGRVDEGCNCTLPEKPCYTGNPRDLERENTACRAGVQSCRLEFYGPCEGEVLPSAESCDGIDNDCNGLVDDIGDCDNTPPRAICPPDQSGFPLANYTFVGGYEDADGDAMTRATWRVLSAPAGSTVAPEPADELTMTVFADLQGDYIFELEVEDAQGGIGRCTVLLTTLTGDGLRIEMIWNANALDDSSDVDMHLKKAPQARWFSATASGDDCFYLNCKVCSRGGEAACRDEIAAYNADPNRDPPPQVMWTEPLNEDDPRLDLDDVEGLGPENINILRPSVGTYRLGVHYYDDDDFGPSTVTVKIFCGGEIAQVFAPTILEVHGQNGGETTEFWEVADIVWEGETCNVQPLGTPACPRICATREARQGGCQPGTTRGRPCR